MSRQALRNWRKSRVCFGTVCVFAALSLTSMIIMTSGIGQETEREEPANEAERKIIVFFGPPELKALFTRYKGYCSKHFANVQLEWEIGTNTVARNMFIHGPVDASVGLFVGMTRPMAIDEVGMCLAADKVPTSHLVACDALAVVVHTSNPATQITLEEFRDIYTGKIGSWKELGGPDGKIHTFGLHEGWQEGSGFDVHFFHEGERGFFPEGERVKDTEVPDTREELVERLRRMPLGIGYVRAQMVFQKKLPKEVKVLKVNGVALTKDLIRSGSYPLAWPVLFYTNGYPAWGSDLHRLATLHLSKEGQSLIEASGYCAVTEYK